jgi:glycosyltransferase involved in cell wall biosynthesis
MAMPAPAAATGTKRLAIVVSSGEVLRRLGTSLIAKVAGGGHRVLALAPNFSGSDARRLDELGVERAAYLADASGPRLFADWKAVGLLKDLLADWAPDIVLACGAKPMVYATLAAKSAGADRIVVIVDQLPQRRFAGELAADEMPAWRYGQALRSVDEAVFYNQEDLSLMQRLGLIPPGLSIATVSGLGVDLQGQAITPLPPLGQGLVFLMIAPLDRRKGVIDYCEAARELRARAPNSRFLLAGAPVDGPMGVAREELAGGAVEYLGRAEDPSALLAQCHVFVYPSHAEGMPQPVLDALTAGRPVIASDVIGCRETVDERVNGCLVVPGNPRELALAMESFLKRPDLIPSLARASRAKAERFSSVDEVNATLLAALGLRDAVASSRAHASS